MKTCTRCGESKPPDAFHKLSTAKDGRRPDCRDCRKHLTAEYRNRPDVRARKAEYDASYRARPQVQARNAEYMPDYRMQNPHAAWVSTYRQRARAYGLPLIVEHFTRKDVIARYGDACADCGGEWDQLDHIIPVSAGGTHTLDNVQPVCRDDNHRRWNEYQRNNTTPTAA
ncbi:HNH endonuclease [Kocuria rosea]|uniref:HNH endonuclease n=1 Tax=Kocuria rosea TaxID=1275 RepID=UPI0021B596EF|nr:HNH endonuclease [Kocuria rosea]